MIYRAAFQQNGKKIKLFLSALKNLIYNCSFFVIYDPVYLIERRKNIHFFLHFFHILCTGTQVPSQIWIEKFAFYLHNPVNSLKIK